MEKLPSALGHNESGKAIAVFGLTFKLEIYDMLDASYMAIIPSLVDKGVVTNALDPQGSTEA